MRNEPNAPVPLHLRNATTGIAKELGYGAGYRYAHDDPSAQAEMSCLPEPLAGRRYYHPSSNGKEPRLAHVLTPTTGETTVKCALFGFPKVGKTTVFNLLTRAEATTDKFATSRSGTKHRPGVGTGFRAWTP